LNYHGNLNYFANQIFVFQIVPLKINRFVQSVREYAFGNKFNQKECSFALFNILTIFESSVKFDVLI